MATKPILTFTTDNLKQVKGIQGGIEYKKHGGIGSMLSGKTPGWYDKNNILINTPGIGSWARRTNGSDVTMYWIGTANPINGLPVEDTDLAFLEFNKEMQPNNFMELNTSLPSKPVWKPATLNEAAKATLIKYNEQVYAIKAKAEANNEEASIKRDMRYRASKREDAEKYEALAIALRAQGRSTNANAAELTAFKAWRSVGMNEFEAFKERSTLRASAPPLPEPSPILSQGGRRKTKHSKRSKRSKKTRRHSRK